jgi:hypothetical protein
MAAAREKITRSFIEGPLQNGTDLPISRENVSAGELRYLEIPHSDRRFATSSNDSSAQRIFPSPLGGDEHESWGVATATLFEIVNRQLVAAPVKFYALNSGNDLTGIFLTEQQAEAARKALKHRSDWPYLPTMHAPWFGQYH